MSVGDFHNNVYAIVQDDVKACEKMQLPIGFESKLLVVSVYFHAYKCMKSLLERHDGWPYIYDCTIISAQNDNDTFIEWLLLKSIFAEKILKEVFSFATRQGSAKVAALLEKHLNLRNVEGIQPLKPHNENLTEILSNVKSAVPFASSYMIECEYDNLSPWIPRELRYDLSGVSFRNAVRRLYYF